MKMTMASHSEHHCFVFLYLQRGRRRNEQGAGWSFRFWRRRNAGN